jgi:hypothetical protein
MYDAFLVQVTLTNGDFDEQTPYGWKTYGAGVYGYS